MGEQPGASGSQIPSHETQREDGPSGHPGRSTKPKRRPSQAKPAKAPSQPKGGRASSVPVRSPTSLIFQISNQYFRALPVPRRRVQLQELRRLARKHPKHLEGQEQIRRHLQRQMQRRNHRGPLLQTLGLLKIITQRNPHLINTSTIVLLFLF